MSESMDMTPGEAWIVTQLRAIMAGRPCPRCMKRPVLDDEAGLCGACNTTQMERDDHEGRSRDWRLGRRVAVKYRNDPRFGLHGYVAEANGDDLAVRADDGSLHRDHQDKWRSA